jgi:hypothetical protein
MYFVSGYSRELPVGVERSASKVALFVVAIAVVLLVIFLSFENTDGEPLPYRISFDAPSGSAEASAVGSGLEIDLERNFWRSDLKNPPPNWWDSQSQ